MSLTLCTFNINNLFLRYQFKEVPPGSLAKKVQSDGHFFFLPQATEQNYDEFKPKQRAVAAKAIKRGGSGANAYPDILCLQEVESLWALRTFNKKHLENGYNHALLVDSHDLRLIDVGILSKRPILSVRTHVDDQTQDKKDYLFSRDCLEVEIDIGRSDGKSLTLLINHLKSKLTMAKTAAKKAKDLEQANKRRELQAETVSKIIHTRWPGNAFNTELFAVVGDFNDEPDSAAVKPLVKDAGLSDAIARIGKKEERWTYYYDDEKTVSQIDYILLSPALNKLTKGKVPVIERKGITTKGMGRTSRKPLLFKCKDDDPKKIEVPGDFGRFKEVNNDLHASDHCPVFIEIPD